MTPTNTRQCAQCQRPFQTRPDAAHQRFCSTKCRQSWHTQRHRAAIAALNSAATPSTPELDKEPTPCPTHSN